MWTLALGDQLYWLLPNQTYTIGRAHDSSFVVTDASVSRKHAEVRVVPPTEDAYLHPSVKSDLVITDLKSRFGTIVDKKQIKGSVTAPQTPHNTVGAQLGRATKLHFRWNPLIVTVFAPKPDSDNVWDKSVQILKPLDVKIVPHVLQNTSIFCQASELITSSLYYALVRQIPVVQVEYLSEIAAYAQICSFTGVKTWELPDSTQFRPQAWAPNPLRSECFANTKYHLRSNIKQDEALKPILEAGGANCADNGWYLLHKGCSLDELHIPLNGEYVSDSAIFAAILESRKLKPSEIKKYTAEPLKKETKQQPPPKKARPRGLKLLDLMTQSQPKKDPEPVEAKPELPTEPTSAQKSDRSSSSIIAQEVTPKKPSPEPKPVRETASKSTRKPTTRKRTRGQTEEEQVKKMKLEESDEESLDLTKEEDPSFEPAVVDSCLTVDRNPPPSTVPLANPSGKANFKAFKKTQVVPRARIELDAEVPEPEESMIQESESEREPSEARDTTNEPITPRESSTGVDEEFGFTFS